MPILANRDLDALGSETLAERRALADTGKFLGGIDLENLRKDRGQHGGTSLVDDAVGARSGVRHGNSDVDKGEPKTMVERR